MHHTVGDVPMPTILSLFPKYKNPTLSSGVFAVSVVSANSNLLEKISFRGSGRDRRPEDQQHRNRSSSRCPRS